MSASSTKASNPDLFLPGTASLVDYLDKPLIVVLRDGKKLFGILRSYDQYGVISLTGRYGSL
jgi:hypothetical protein